MNKALMLNEIQKHLNFEKDSEFADHLGITKQTLSNWKKRNTFDAELIYTKCLLINPSWLLSGEGNVLKSTHEEINTLRERSIISYITKSKEEKGVPFWDLPVSAGHSLTDIKGKVKPAGYVVGLPGADIAENIFPVTGMSMEPEVSSSAIIGVRKIDNWETLNTERIYLIITRDDRMIKRIQHDEDNSEILWCVSPNYPKFKVYKSEIIEIQRVCFVYNPK